MDYVPRILCSLRSALSQLLCNIWLFASITIFQAIQQLQSRSAHAQTPVNAASLAIFLIGAALDIFQTLIVELDTEGRYLFLNAIANQLRYPNTHTHYFSFVLLYLFAEANQVIAPLLISLLWVVLRVLKCHSSWYNMFDLSKSSSRARSEVHSFHLFWLFWVDTLFLRMPRITMIRRCLVGI